MNSIFINNKFGYTKYVLIEKINHQVNEVNFLDILKYEYGFRNKTYKKKLSNSELILKKLGFPVKEKIGHYFEVYETKINENKYEVCFDIWSVALRKNGFIIFDKTDFKDEDFLKLLI